MNYQVIFMDNAGIIYSGIWNQDRDEVICGCCGGLIPKDEIGEEEDKTHKILEVYEEWISLNDAMLD